MSKKLGLIISLYLLLRFFTQRTDDLTKCQVLHNTCVFHLLHMVIMITIVSVTVIKPNDPFSLFSVRVETQRNFSKVFLWIAHSIVHINYRYKLSVVLLLILQPFYIIDTHFKKIFSFYVALPLSFSVGMEWACCRCRASIISIPPHRFGLWTDNINI